MKHSALHTVLAAVLTLCVPVALQAEEAPQAVSGAAPSAAAPVQSAPAAAKPAEATPTATPAAAASSTATPAVPQATKEGAAAPVTPPQSATDAAVSAAAKPAEATATPPVPAAPQAATTSAPATSAPAEAGTTAPATAPQAVTDTAAPAASKPAEATAATPAPAAPQATTDTGAPTAPKPTETGAAAPAVPPVAGSAAGAAPSAAAKEATLSSSDAAARFLAGMAPGLDSPLDALTKNRQWQSYARSMDASFDRVEENQLSRIRAWSARNLAQSRPTLFYMFSGPDFLYASSFFPKAKTYILAGLEPVGAIPDPEKLKGRMGLVLGELRTSLSTIVNYSFFKTKDMKAQFHSGEVNGTLPILYVFLARTGNTIQKTELVRVDREGALQPDVGSAPADAPRGVKISFRTREGEEKTLFYFSTNLANDGVRDSGFLKFCESFGPADAFIKSASYLLHTGGFSTVRQFLLTHATAIVQDDSGIPLNDFDREVWQLNPFGRYAGPIPLFAGYHQAAYAKLFKNATPLNFGIGYRWRPQESNLLLAVRLASTARSGQ